MAIQIPDLASNPNASTGDELFEIAIGQNSYRMKLDEIRKYIQGTRQWQLMNSQRTLGGIYTNTYDYEIWAYVEVWPTVDTDVGTVRVVGTVGLLSFTQDSVADGSSHPPSSSLLLPIPPGKDYYFVSDTTVGAGYVSDVGFSWKEFI